MAKECSFDIVSNINLQEVDNAVNQAVKEITVRYDFKGSKSKFDYDKTNTKITLTADDEFKLRSLRDILDSKMAKRGVPLKSLKYGKEEGAEDGCVRQIVELTQGISHEKAKEIVRIIKDTKLKVQASIQGDQVRVTGKQKDDLQHIIQLIKNNSRLDIALQFVNFR